MKSGIQKQSIKKYYNKAKTYNNNINISTLNSFNSNNYITLINKDNKTKTCKVGFSWTSLFFVYLVPLFRGDFKNLAIQILLYSVCMIIPPISPVLVTVVCIGIAIYYNNIYIKNLVNKGYRPYLDKDIILLDKILKNNAVAKEKKLDLSKEVQDNKLDLRKECELDIKPKINSSQAYDNLIKRKDELVKALEDVDYKVEENIKEFKLVLDKLLEISPNDEELLDLLAEITIKEDYLIALYKVQYCVNRLNESRNLSAYMFNHYLSELKDIYLPKLRESEERNLNVCRTPLYEIDKYVEEKTKQYERKVKREEKEYRDKRNYVVFDLETTGLSSITDEITEIGAVKVIDGKVEDTFEMLVKPNKKISQKITNITGITNEMVENKPPIEEVLPQFIDFIGGLPLVAHNVEFDYGFLCENYRNIYGKEFRRKRSCTMKMYRKWYKEEWDEKAPSAKLGDVILDLLGGEEYRLYTSNSHRGLNDAEFTQKVYEKLI